MLIRRAALKLLSLGGILASGGCMGSTPKVNNPQSGNAKNENVDQGAAIWARIESIFAARNCLGAFELNPPASSQEIAALEQHLRVELPTSFKQLLALHNGQKSHCDCGIIFGLELLSVDGIRRNWDGWRSLDGEGMNEELASAMKSQPVGFIKPLYLNAGWIPFTHDGGGNHFGIDFDPAEKGRRGQVIAFGRDDDVKKLVASSFDEVLAKYLRQLQEIAWSITGDGWQFKDEKYRVHYHDWEV